jgi:Protein of unknown function (DUF3140)
MSGEDSQVVKDFKQVVNMSPKQLTGWLETEESQQVGQKDGGDESIGHKSGQRIVKLLGQKSDFSAEDLEHMRKVVSYVRRHSAQRPHGDVKDSRWRFSLMNWGHDPLKED